MNRYLWGMMGLLGLPMLALMGCASQPEVKWKRSMGNYFQNNSVRPAEPPRHLWDRRDEEMLLRRMGYSDTVALGTIRLVSHYTRRGHSNQLSLAFRARETLYGSLKQDLDQNNELHLRLGPTAGDYRYALSVQKQLPGTRYLLFIKRRPRKDGTHSLQWAFYRPRRKLLVEVRTRYRWLRQAGEKARARIVADEPPPRPVRSAEPLVAPEPKSPSTTTARSTPSSFDEPGFLGRGQ